jgi:hypothetical protein
MSLRISRYSTVVEETIGGTVATYALLWEDLADIYILRPSRNGNTSLILPDATIAHQNQAAGASFIVYNDATANGRRLGIPGRATSASYDQGQIAGTKVTTIDRREFAIFTLVGIGEKKYTIPGNSYTETERAGGGWIVQLIHPDSS